MKLSDSRTRQAPVESPFLSNLRHLQVNNSVLGATDIQRLFQAARLTHLRCLKLNDVGWRPRTLEGVRPAIPFAEPCAIDLSSNGPGDEGALMLCQPGWPRQLERVALRRNYIGTAAMQALLSSPFCGRAQQIDLSGNRVTDTERAMLMALAATKNLRLVL